MDNYEGTFNYYIKSRQEVNTLSWWKNKIADWFNIPVQPKYMYTIKGNHNVSTIQLNTLVRILVDDMWIWLRCIEKTQPNDTFITTEPTDILWIENNNSVPIQVIGQTLPWD